MKINRFFLIFSWSLNCLTFFSYKSRDVGGHYQFFFFLSITRFLPLVIVYHIWVKISAVFQKLPKRDCWCMWNGDFIKRDILMLLTL